MSDQNKLSRRDFIKGAATAGAGLAAVTALGACSTTPADSRVPTKWDYEADVVIIGLGGAGACAAIEATDAGAKVLVLEKQPEATHYCNSRMSGGIIHTPDPTGDRASLEQLLQGMFSGENLPWKVEGEQPDKMPEMAKVFAEGELQILTFLKGIDPELVLNPSGESAFTMFPGAAAAKYQSTTPRYADYQNAPPEIARYKKFSLPKAQKSGGEALFYALRDVGMKKRNIQVLYGAPASRLVESGGEILGAIAKMDGKEIAVRAKRAVVLTAGGYEYNKAQRKAFLEGPGVKGWCFYGSPDNTGDGIEMAIKIGAGLAKVGKAASRIESAVPFGRGWDETGMKMGIMSASGAVNSFVVDNFGKRYANENDITTGAWRYQFYKMAVQYDMYTMDYPRCPSWQIFDETARARQAMAQGSSVAYGFVPWGEDNLRAIQEGWILKGDTIAELAGKIKAHAENKGKMDPTQLAKTVEAFNKYAAAGEDLDFKRPKTALGPVVKPPFYAQPLYPGGPNTKGGVDADAQRHVLDWKGKPIKRLYSAGEISSCFKFTYQAGGNITECIVCGRLAGRNAAAEKPVA
jgi:3-oxosteroid 1-dehydrogenase